MMITMTSPRFTMRLEPELKDWLEEEGKRRDRSASYLAKEAIRDLKARTEAKTRIIEAAVAEADQGHFVSEEAMSAWFESLGTDQELAEPEADVFPDRP
jgi:predicted transcriptional regulator